MPNHNTIPSRSTHSDIEEPLPFSQPHLWIFLTRVRFISTSSKGSHKNCIELTRSKKAAKYRLSFETPEEKELVIKTIDSCKDESQQLLHRSATNLQSDLPNSTRPKRS